ncbi:uncharacterized protein TNIN_164821 [Trichonephila inaurata madagascariensis]|uniref:Uncharacterized protein n=1 Tax=Trichonephila inaurata madagascariensis TaxID=2747483 RepID=A0A8X6XVL8_9ARAC|nr:uncharacterized protein TNIN_164821 [Trichonephila inaurata madagascariensis]
MEHLKVYLLIFVVVFGDAVNSLDVTNKNSQNSTDASKRKSRTDYAVYNSPDNYASKKKPSVFSPPDSDGDNFQPVQDPQFAEQNQESQFPPLSGDDVPLGFYKPKPRYYSPKDLYKSGTNTNWNVWKGEPEAPEMKPPPMPPMKGVPPPPPDFEEYYLPADSWKGDPWAPEKMATMMMMINEMKPKPGILSTLKKDPTALLLAAAIPVSLIMAAVLPTLMNMMMNGGLPTVTTTATGTKARSLDGLQYLSPVINAVSTFGSRALDNPECMQRIFCQVTKGATDNDTESRPVQKLLRKVSTFVDERYLNSLGVKKLLDSMVDGDCEKIPCSDFKSKNFNGNTRRGKINLH